MQPSHRRSHPGPSDGHVSGRLLWRLLLGAGQPVERWRRGGRCARTISRCSCGWSSGSAWSSEWRSGGPWPRSRVRPRRAAARGGVRIGALLSALPRHHPAALGSCQRTAPLSRHRLWQDLQRPDRRLPGAAAQEGMLARLRRGARGRDGPGAGCRPSRRAPDDQLSLAAPLPQGPGSDAGGAHRRGQGGHETLFRRSHKGSRRWRQADAPSERPPHRRGDHGGAGRGGSARCRALFRQGWMGRFNGSPPAACRTISAGDGPASGRPSQVPPEPGFWLQHARPQQPAQTEPSGISEHLSHASGCGRSSPDGQRELRERSLRVDAGRRMVGACRRAEIRQDCPGVRTGDVGGTRAIVQQGPAGIRTPCFTRAYPQSGCIG